MISITAITYNGQPLAQPLSADFDEMGGNIGRGDANTLVLPDPERHISRTHAAVVFRGGAYAIRDQGTATPVYVNRQPLGNGREAPIADGDEIRLGGYTLQVKAKVQAVPERAPAPAAPAIDDPLAIFGSPSGGPDPFAHLVTPAPKPSAASIQAKRMDDPFALPLRSDGSATGAIPADFDPFADPAPHLSSSPAAHLPDDFSLGLGPAASSNQSIDDLFGLGPGAGADPFAPSNPLARPAGFPGDSSNVDPLVAFGGAPNVRPGSMHSQRDDTPEMQGSFRMPEIRPEPPGKPSETATDDMLLSWESSDAGSDGGEIRTMIIRSPNDRPLDSEHGASSAGSVDPLALFGANPAVPPGADPLSINAPRGNAAQRDTSAAPHSSPTPARQPQAAPPPRPAARPAAQAEPARAAPAAPVRPMPAPPPMAAADASATPSSPVQQEELLRALLAGAGVPELKMPGGLTPQLMNVFGQLLRESTQGTLDLLLARALTKREVRAEVTMIVARENNPLKFSPTAEAALAHLLAPQGRGFMTPMRAMKDAYDDLRSHQLGFMAGMQAALSGVLARFNPEQLEKRLSQKKGVMDSLLPMNRRAKLWDLFAELYGDISKEAEEDFHALFGKEFLRAYEAQIAKLDKEDKEEKR